MICDSSGTRPHPSKGRPWEFRAPPGLLHAQGAQEGPGEGDGGRRDKGQQGGLSLEEIAAYKFSPYSQTLPKPQTPGREPARPAGGPSCPRFLSCFQMFVGLLFWFQFYCGFSASAMIDQWYLIFFNLLFSSLPQLVTGVLDKDVPADVLLTEPQLYRSGQNMEVGPPTPFTSQASL